MLAQGTEIWLARSGRSYRVGRLLGEGSQGSVHELIPVRESGRPQALKWYFPVAGTARQRSGITELVERGSPGSMFLWPTELVEGNSGDFGYVMPLRDKRFAGLSDLLVGRVDAPLSIVVRLCMELAHGFLQLHAQGLCYRDISFGNVFFDPGTGVPLICDNDNVGVDGESDSAVLGTPRFMAPEIVRGESMPNTQTDLYSLAVLIFYVLLVHHPLLGRRELQYPCLDRQVEDRLFGHDPLFVFDESDPSNAPDPVVHATVVSNWDMLPDFVRNLFRQAFGPGLVDPHTRVRESVWRSAMSRLLDGIATCDRCGRENLSNDGAVGACWSCGHDIDQPMRLVIDGRGLVLHARGRLCRHHVLRDYDYDTVWGRVVQHPERDVWGLLNSSPEDWTITVPGRGSSRLPPGRTMALVPGTTIELRGHSLVLA